MKNVEVKKIIQAIETSDGAGVKLKRSIGTPEANYIDPVSYTHLTLPTTPYV